MQKNNFQWILIILLILIVVLVIPSGLQYGYRGSMHSGYGMMGPGMMGFFWLVPVLLLIVVIAVGVWLGNLLSARGRFLQSNSTDVCPHCAKPTEAEWKTCPFCSKKL